MNADVDIEEPDEKSVMTYVSSLYDVFPEVPSVEQSIRDNVNMTESFFMPKYIVCCSIKYYTSYDKVYWYDLQFKCYTVDHLYVLQQVKFLDSHQFSSMLLVSFLVCRKNYSSLTSIMRLLLHCLPG